MGDVNLEIKLKNVKDKTDQIDVDNASNGQVLTYDNATKTFKPADGGSGTSYITSVSNDFIVDNGNLELSDDFKASISDIEDTIEENADWLKKENSKSNVELTNLTQNYSNPNLLDNGWFTVNQRSVSGKVSANIYTLDRWKTLNYASNAECGTGYIKGSEYTDAFAQFFEDENFLVGKTFTISVLINGVVYSRTFSNYTNKADFVYGPIEDKVYVQVGTITGWGETKPCFSVSSLGDRVQAVKLELGSVSTLANDIAPNYAEELLKCQRYFVRFKANTGSHGFVLGHPVSATAMRFPVTLPTFMRTNEATVTMGGILRTTMSSSANLILCEGCARIDMMANVIILQTTAKENLTIGSNYLMIFNDTNTYIDISCDL